MSGRSALRCCTTRYLSSDRNDNQLRKAREETTMRSTLSNLGIVLQSVAPSVADGLVWSDTIPGELPSARGGARIASSPTGRAIADGWFVGARPDNSVAKSLPLARCLEFGGVT